MAIPKPAFDLSMSSFKLVYFWFDSHNLFYYYFYYYYLFLLIFLIFLSHSSSLFGQDQRPKARVESPVSSVPGGCTHCYSLDPMLTPLLSLPYLRFLLRERIFFKGLCRRTVMILVHPPSNRGFGHLPIFLPWVRTSSKVRYFYHIV